MTTVNREKKTFWILDKNNMLLGVVSNSTTEAAKEELEKYVANKKDKCYLAEKVAIGTPRFHVDVVSSK